MSRGRYSNRCPSHGRRTHSADPDAPNRSPDAIRSTRMRIVLVAHEPSRQHRRGGARDAHDGPRRARARRAARFPDRRRDGARLRRDARARRRRASSPRSTTRSPVRVVDRPVARGRASSPAACCRSATRRAEAIARTRATATSRSCSAARCRGCRTTSSRAAALVATIPANPAYASLNLAAAVQVAAYELRLGRAAASDVWQAPRFAPATHDDDRGPARARASARSPRCASSIRRCRGG